ncbi:MAG: hypothetical protein AB7L66_14540 [Gemmatimonadales bacterium]
MSVLSPITRGLVEQLAAAPRGPRRDGLFALWLAVRLLEEAEPTAGSVDRGFRRRVTLTEKRISSLALQPPVRRGLTATLRALNLDPGGDRARLFEELARAARDAGNPDASALLSKAARVKSER